MMGNEIDGSSRFQDFIHVNINDFIKKYPAYCRKMTAKTGFVDTSII